LESKNKLPSQTGGIEPTTEETLTQPTTEPTTQPTTQPTGGFTRPEGGYTVDYLEKQLKSGTLSGTQRATAMQQLKILLSRQAKKAPPKGGFTGARVPGQKEPMNEYEAKYVANYLKEAVKEGYSNLSDKDIAQVENALMRRASGGEMLLEDFESEDALEAAMNALNYTFYPSTKEGYAGVWGGGRKKYGRSES
jgi:hypothetical protein